MALLLWSVPGPVTWLLPHQVPSNITAEVEEGTCTVAVLLLGPQRTAGPRSLYMLLSLWWALAAILPYQASATPDMRKRWCLTGRDVIAQHQKKKKKKVIGSDAFLDTTSSLGSKPKFLANFCEIDYQHRLLF